MEVTRSARYPLVLALALGCALAGLRAQSPFDIAGRRGADSAARAFPSELPREATPPEVAPTGPPSAAPSVADSPAAAASPFDLRRGRPAPARDAEAAAGTAAVPAGGSAAATATPPTRARFDALLCAGLLILFAVSFVVQGGTLRRMWQAAFNSNLLTRLQREQRMAGAYWWAFLGAVVIGSFAYVAAREVAPRYLGGGWGLLDAFVLAALGLTAARLLVLAVVGWTFHLAKPLGAYRTLVLVWAAVVGAILFPAVVLVCFAPPSMAAAVSYLGVAVAAAGYLWRGLRALGAAGRYVTAHPGHFLLYFCALEISPLAIGLTWLSS